MTTPWLGRTARAADVAVVAWCAAWIWMGFTISDDIRGLTELSGTLRTVGHAMVQTGDTVAALESLPIVGDRAATGADTIRAAGASAVESARTSGDSVRRSALLLGLSVALIPTLPVLLLHVPRRVAAIRRRRSLLAALAAGRGDDIAPYLALRALVELPLEALPRRGERGLADVLAGRHDELAAMQLRWLDIDPARLQRPGR